MTNSGAIIETNRGCPYGCTFCDWGSATLSRIRKFDSTGCSPSSSGARSTGSTAVCLADANFGIFERDVEIAEKVAELKRPLRLPEATVGTNYAKNTVKHLRQIVEMLADAGILTEGLLSLQSMDDDTLDADQALEHQAREVRGARQRVPRTPSSRCSST